MNGRLPVPSREGVLHRPPFVQGSHSGGESTTDGDHARIFRRRSSSNGSVNSTLIEGFSGSPDAPVGKPNPPAKTPRSSRPRWMERMVRGVLRGAIKRRVRKLVAEFIEAWDGSEIALQRRYKVARDLINIIDGEPDGEEIVGREFATWLWRPDGIMRPLLKLSDDELKQFGYKAINPAFKSITFTRLIGILLKYSNTLLVFSTTLSSELEIEETYGTAAILYLAMTETPCFFHGIKDALIFDFCKRVFATEVALCPKWFCAAKLFCLLLAHKRSPKFRQELLINKLLSYICKALIREATVPRNQDVTAWSEDPRTPSLSLLLPLIAVCCNSIRTKMYWTALPAPDTLSHFIDRLVNLLPQQDTNLSRLNTGQGYAISILLSLLKNPVIVRSIPQATSSKLGAIFMRLALYQLVVKIHEGDIFAQSILKPLNFSLDFHCIDSLCRLPESTFSEVLKSALSNGIFQLNSPNTRNPSEPLGLVERLLWLSKLRIQFRHPGQLHIALVNGDACRFLGHVLCRDEGPNLSYRALWRTKGLAMTCLGDIIERMDGGQLRNHISKEMMDTVVAIKEHGRVPEVQKGQAILLLKRYTLAADRWGIRPYHREDTTDLAEQF